MIRWNNASAGSYEAAGDPSIAATRKNVFWYANLAFNRSTSESGIAVSRSTDGGANWKTSFVVENNAPPDGRILLNDKPWIAADPSNPEKAHVTWTRFQTGDPFSPIAYSFTTNGGRTWSIPKTISKGDDNQGSHIVVDDFGGVHVVWFGYSGTTPVIQYRQKAGARFKKQKTLSSIDPIRSPVAWANFYTNSFPSIAVDGETLHVVWPNWNGQDSDIVYIRSEDRGKTWSSPIAVDGRTQDQFLPRVAAFGGTVAIGYLDHYRERGSGYHVGVVISRDGGLTWSKPKRVSTKRSDPERGNRFSFPACTAEFIGDYNGIAVGSDHRVHLFWTDIRSGNSTADPGSTSDQDPYIASIQP